MKAIIEFPDDRKEDFHRMMEALNGDILEYSKEISTPLCYTLESIGQFVDEFCKERREDGEQVILDDYFDREAVAEELIEKCTGYEDYGQDPAYDAVQDVLNDYQERAGFLHDLREDYPKTDMKEAAEFAASLPADVLQEMSGRDFLREMKHHEKKQPLSR